MTPDRLLMLIAAESSREGYTVPQLDTDQARTAAERLIAAVGLARPDTPRQLTASPDQATRELPPVPQDPRHGVLPRQPWPHWTRHPAHRTGGPR